MTGPTTQELQALPLFGGIGLDGLSCLAQRCDVVRVNAGDVVFTEGEAARTLYIVHTGSLEVIKRGVDGEVVLGVVAPGECVGEMSFIDMQPRSATVRAVEPTELWVWSYQSIHERYCADLKCGMLLVMNMARELSRRLRRADDVIASTPPGPAVPH